MMAAMLIFNILVLRSARRARLEARGTVEAIPTLLDGEPSLTAPCSIENDKFHSAGTPRGSMTGSRGARRP